MTANDGLERWTPAGAATPLAPIAVALGHLVLLPVVPADLSLGLPATPGQVTLLVGEGIFAAVLTGSVLRRRPSLRGLIALLIATVALGSVVWVGLQTAALWLAAAALVATAAVAAYLLHRVELVRLGLVGGGPEP